MIPVETKTKSKTFSKVNVITAISLYLFVGGLAFVAFPNINIFDPVTKASTVKMVIKKRSVVAPPPRPPVPPVAPVPSPAAPVVTLQSCGTPAAGWVRGTVYTLSRAVTVSNNQQECFSVNVDGVTFDGNNFEINPMVGGSYLIPAFRVSASNITLRNFRIHGFTGKGIFIATNVSGIHIINNIFENNGLAIGSDGNNVTQSEITGNTVRSTIFGQYRFEGINLHGFSSSTFSNNRFNNVITAMTIRGASPNARIENNTFEDNGLALLLDNVSGYTITNNRFINNWYSAMKVTNNSMQNTISFNRFTNNSNFIYNVHRVANLDQEVFTNTNRSVLSVIDASSNNIFDSNIFDGNQYNTVFVHRSSRNIFRGNSFRNNLNFNGSLGGNVLALLDTDRTTLDSNVFTQNTSKAVVIFQNDNNTFNTNISLVNNQICDNYLDVVNDRKFDLYCGSVNPALFATSTGNRLGKVSNGCQIVGSSNATGQCP